MSQNKPKVLFITGLYSPFQLDVTYEINKLDLFEYYLAFTVPCTSRRGSYWMVPVKEQYHHYIMVADEQMSVEARAEWAAQTILKVKPQIVITGNHKGPVCIRVVTIQ